MCLRSDFTTGAPRVITGTKWPSITSTCRRSARARRGRPRRPGGRSRPTGSRARSSRSRAEPSPGAYGAAGARSTSTYMPSVPRAYGSSNAPRPCGARRPRGGVGRSELNRGRCSRGELVDAEGLLGGEGAHRVHEQPAGLHQRRGGEEQLALERGALLDHLGGEAPAGVGATAQHADAASTARRAARGRRCRGAAADGGRRPRRRGATAGRGAPRPRPRGGCGRRRGRARPRSPTGRRAPRWRWPCRRARRRRRRSAPPAPGARISTTAWLPSSCGVARPSAHRGEPARGRPRRSPGTASATSVPGRERPRPVRRRRPSSSMSDAWVATRTLGRRVIDAGSFIAASARRASRSPSVVGEPGDEPVGVRERDRGSSGSGKGGPRRESERRLAFTKPLARGERAPMASTVSPTAACGFMPARSW